MQGIFTNLEAKISGNDWEGAKYKSILVGIAMAYYGLFRTVYIMKINTHDFHRLVDEEDHAYYTVI